MTLSTRWGMNVRTALFPILTAFLMSLAGTGMTHAADAATKPEQAALNDTNAMVVQALKLIAAGGEADFQQARALLAQAAERGHANAQNNLGRLLVFGKGGPADVEQGVAWYEKAIGQGSYAAAYNLGMLYEGGKLIDRDIPRAIELYETAALHPTYQMPPFRLGEIYRMGIGVPADSERAARWYRKAAVRGHAKSQFTLARLIEAEQGDTDDLWHAAVFYLLAESNGVTNAKTFHEKLVARMPSPPNDNLQTILNSGSAQIVARLGARYLLGWFGHDRDEDRGRLLLEIASANGGGDAMFLLGVAELLHDPQRADYERAVPYFEQAAKRGVPDGLYNIGWMHFTGQFGEPDYAAALQYFSKAALKGNVRATLALATMARDGIGAQKNPRSALALYRKIAAKMPKNRTFATPAQMLAWANVTRLEAKVNAATTLSDEGTFFRDSGASNPLHRPASTILGERLAVLYYCKQTRFAETLKKAIDERIVTARTDSNRQTLRQRIELAYTNLKMSLKLRAAPNFCNPEDHAERANGLVVDLMDYDWGFKEKPTDYQQVITIGSEEYLIGELSNNQADHKAVFALNLRPPSNLF